MGHDRARRSGGRFLLRIEDLDQGRSRPEFVSAIEDDLRWLGLDWDDAPLVQSRRAAAYEEALDRLRGLDVVYLCFCSRADIAGAASAPHGPVSRYPGTCRGAPGDPTRRASRPHSWRLDSARALAITDLPGWHEGETTFRASATEIDDVILARKDAPAAYHLACVVDDSASGVTLVTRGEDLRPSTPVQRLLQSLLDYPEPDYRHHRLIGHSGGRRLAKRDRAPTLAAMRGAGVDGRDLARRLLADDLPLGFDFLDR